MRHFLIFATFISIFIQSVFAQNYFKVSEVDSSRDEEKIRVFEGEQLSNEDCAFDFANEKLRKRDRLHLILDSVIISILPSKDIKLSLDYFFYGPTDLMPSHIGPQHNLNQYCRYEFDVIGSGKVYITDRKTGLGHRGKIKEGDFTIRYDFVEKSMIVIMTEVQVDWNKKEPQKVNKKESKKI